MLADLMPCHVSRGYTRVLRLMLTGIPIKLINQMIFCYLNFSFYQRSSSHQLLTDNPGTFPDFDVTRHCQQRKSDIMHHSESRRQLYLMVLVSGEGNIQLC